MTKYPLFGDYSDPSYTSRFISLIATAVFCLIFFVCALFIKPGNRKKEYKTVQIVLNSEIPDRVKAEAAATSAPAASSAQETELTAPAASSSASAPVETAPVKKTEAPAPAAQKSEAAIKKSASKTSSTKTEASKSSAQTSNKYTTVPTTYAVDPMEAFNNQTASTASKEFDWSQFDNEASAATSEVKKLESPSASSFSGTAGTVSSNQSQKATASSSTVSNSKNSTTSNSTNSALSSIAKASSGAETSSGSNGVSTQTSKSGKSSSDSVLKWTGGSARTLIYPKQPEIQFSENSQKLIDIQSLMISFTVNSNGYVERNSVKTSPVVASQVLTEIQDQVCDWWFDEGDSSASASLLVNIVRK